MCHVAVTHSQMTVLSDGEERNAQTCLARLVISDHGRDALASGVNDLPELDV